MTNWISFATPLGDFSNYGSGYWSSTEYNTDNAWIQDFNNGNQDNVFKIDHPENAFERYWVRAVRAF